MVVVGGSLQISRQGSAWQKHRSLKITEDLDSMILLLNDWLIVAVVPAVTLVVSAWKMTLQSREVPTQECSW
jgi:hypothetical protein